MRPARQCAAPRCRRRIPPGGKAIYCCDRCRQAGHRQPKDAPRPVDSDTWQTPPYILEAVRDALGCIDLDPASTCSANERVRAARYYTLERGEDGAALPWAGSVWLNPPFGRGAVEPFAARLAAHWRAGRPGACILRADGLVTAWAAPLLGSCSCVIVPRRRVRFVAPSGAELPAPNFGSVLLAAGASLRVEPLHRLGVVLSSC